MPDILLTRIDNRLVHGQVGVSWLAYSKANLILIADDEVANDKLQHVRQEKIRDLLLSKGTVTLSELCQTLCCSEATIRNDLAKLVMQGIL